MVDDPEQQEESSMSEIYPFLPAAVEVFRVGSKTDMILRKDIKSRNRPMTKARSIPSTPATNASSVWMVC